MKPVLTGMTAIALVGMLSSPSFAIGMHDFNPRNGLADPDMRTGALETDMCNPVVDGVGNPVAQTTGRVLRSGGTQPCVIKAAASTTTMERAVTIDSDLAFDFDKSAIRPSYFSRLDEIAKELKAHPGMTVKVAGYTDSTGAEAYNQKLSDRRAQAVFDYLAKEGVPTSAMTMEAFGETHPIASNATAEGRAQNRRVEIAGATMVTPMAAASPEPAAAVSTPRVSGPQIADGTIVGLDFNRKLVKLDGERSFKVNDLFRMDELKTGNPVTVHYRIDGGQNVAFDILQREHEAQS